jgi:hypothetical protein
MLPRKMHALLEYAAANFEFDYLFKTDDDTYLDLQRFIGFDLRSADYVGQFCEMSVPVPEISKTWHYGKCLDKTLEVPYERPFVCPWATGAGYFLSRHAVQVASERTATTFSQHLFEDVMIGEALSRDPQLALVSSLFSDMGVINPLLPREMRYVQDLLTKKRQFTEGVLALRQENAQLGAETGLAGNGV